MAEVHAFLHNIRSVYNVGSMFRSADGAGIARLYLCGYTATPEHRKLHKTALGAEEAVPWLHDRDGLGAAVRLRAAGYHLWALELAPAADSLFAVGRLPQDAPVVLVVGNEVQGLEPELLALCERVLAIPMRGVKESLNVAVAFGVAAYHLCQGLEPAGSPLS